MKSVKIFQVLIWCTPILLFGGLLWRYLSPTGVRVVVYEMGDASPFVQRLLPDSRVSDVTGNGATAAVTLLDEPVYFSVTPPPGNFTEVNVELAFDPGGTPTFELGGLQDVASQSFAFQPLSNDLLEHLGWTRHELENGLSVFSRDQQSQAYGDFLVNPPDRSVVATYRATYPSAFRLNDYRPLGTLQKFDVSLRGPHELLTYIKDEDFGLFLTYTDVNRSYGADEGSVRVLDEAGNLMVDYVLQDDGNIYDNQYPSVKQTISLSGHDWPEGVYRIVLSGTSDIFWRSILTPQRYLVVKNRVFLGDDVGYLPSPRSTTVYADADRITFETQHQEGVQTVQVGDDAFQIAEVGGKYAATLSSGELVPVRSPVGDVKMTGEGKYAFSEESFFDPDPTPVTAFTDLADTNVQYVLAQLAPVAYDNGWRIASGTFETADLAVENGAYKFALSAPGIHDDLGRVEIHGVTVTFTKAPMTAHDVVLALKHAVKVLLP